MGKARWGGAEGHGESVCSAAGVWDGAGNKCVGAGAVLRGSRREHGWGVGRFLGQRVISPEAAQR